MWHALLSETGFHVVETCQPLVLAEIVQTHYAWLASSQGEGLVLNLGGKLAKLKSAGELQHSTPSRLEKAIQTAALCVQEPRVVQTLQAMLSIANMCVHY